MFYVYILKSDLNNKYYVGCTGDIVKRLSEHNKGKSSHTKHGIPWEIVYREIYSELGEARKRERQIKNWKRRSMIEKLINGPIV